MYESYYQFTALPFRLNPDPRVFFPSASHKRAMAYLRYGTERGEGFVVLLGGVGAGKTTLMEKLFADSLPGTLVTAKVVSTRVDADDLLRLIVAAFGLPFEGVSKAGLLHSLTSFLEGCAKANKRVLLVVDEAQNLNVDAVEELRMLSNFQHGGGSSLQIFLLAQDEFATTLVAPQLEPLRQRVLASYRLQPLTRDELKNYIEHRLRAVGWADTPSLSDSAYDEIYNFTGGVPRRVNFLCDRLFLYGYLEQQQAFDADTVRAVIRELADEVVTSAGEQQGKVLDELPAPKRADSVRKISGEG